MSKKILSLILVLALVLGMVTGVAFAAEDSIPFKVYLPDNYGEIPYGEEITTITKTTIKLDCIDVTTGESIGKQTCYKVVVPEYDAYNEEVYGVCLEIPGYVEQNYGNGAPLYYPATTADCDYSVDDGVASYPTYIELDPNGDGQNDVIYVKQPTGNYVIKFVIYGTEDNYGEDFTEDEGGETEPENDWHFEKITIDGTEIAAENIEYKGIYSMGDLETDDSDYYDYIHEVPLYVVTVPCGTEYVDVTYSAETDIMNSGSDAYGYFTEDVQIDAMSSATVKGTTFKNGYTKNADGTQTVKTPVKNYTLAKAKAITLEENEAPFAAVCLFTFVYDGEHVYTSKVTPPTCTADGYTAYTCTCGDSYTGDVVKTGGHNFVDGECTVCFEPDPDYVAGGELVIPEGAPFTDVKADVEGAVTVKDMGTLTYNGTSAPYYKLTVPAGTTNVSVTHPSSVDPFYDESYDAAYGYYVNTADGTGGYVTLAGEAAEDGAVVVYPLSYTAMDYSTFEEVTVDFTNGYAVGVEDNNYAPIVFFSFEYAAGTGGEVEDPCAEGHTWDEGAVTTEPTCTKEGVMTYTCTVCEKETKTEPIETLEHEYSEETDKCSCGALKPEHKHAYDEYTQTKAPTCTAAGSETATCKCGATDTKSVPNLGHSFSADEKFCTNGCGTVNDEYVDVNAPAMENGVYIIETAAHLIWFANEINTVDNTLSAVLAADIDLTGGTWTSIGTSSKKFAGSFDGEGHKITFANHSSLFGYIKGASNTARAEIKNLVIEGSVTASAFAAYAANANFDKCINRADVTSGNKYASGILGRAGESSGVTSSNPNVSITNCGNEGAIKGSSQIGGILGYSQGSTTILNCYNTGAISGSSEVGGIAGYMQGYKGACSITNCYNTGKISGGTSGGIIGNLYNSANISNSYNAGEATYGYAGNLYNQTATITNSYYLVTKSTMGAPAVCQDTKPNNNAMVSKTLAEMTSEEFVTLLGAENFKQSCPVPVLSWQEAKAHNMENGVCSECGLGAKQSFNVTMSTGAGYTVVGANTVEEGTDYTFTVEITEGYWKTDAFKVYVNGNLILSETDTYVFEDVAGPISITVSGVELIPENHTITLPETGHGYAVNGEKQIKRGSDYTFTVTFANGFKAGENFKVTANGNKITADENGVYTIANVLKDQVIAVSGTEMIPYEDTAKVRFSVTYGTDEFYKDSYNRVLSDIVIDVPYFDLSLYGLEKYYYNPHCYVDENGVERENGFVGGNTETAYGNITAIHAFISFTEIYYLGYDATDVGKGLSYENGEFAKALSWTGGAGSSFMNFWDWGENLNYYVNYEYPLGQIKRAQGSTSDQIRVEDGTLISMHLIKGNANGSNYMYFASNDTDGIFNINDGLDTKTVTQGEKVTLTLFKSKQASKYTTGYNTMGNKQLLWIAEEDFDYNVKNWNSASIDGSAAFTTDANGRITIDTSKLEPGIYYISAIGGMTDAEVLDDGFESSGFEYGPALFELTVEEGDEPEIVLGDVNGDGEIKASDASLIQQYAVNISIAGFDEKAADVNGDGKITAGDASLVLQYATGIITEFKIS